MFVLQVVKILEKHDPLRSSSTSTPLSVLNLSASSGRFTPIPGDEANAVQNYVEHMLFLLIEEESGQAGAMGPILEFVVMENVMERLFVWSLRRQFTDDMKLEQLKLYEMLVGQARQPLLHHKPVLRPLMMLLSSCSGTAAPPVEAELVLLLNQLCCVLARDPSILELFFHTSEDQGATNFLIFSLLIPFIHREGTVGQQARDALLLIMSLSAENQRVAKHVAENTYFCPVSPPHQLHWTLLASCVCVTVGSSQKSSPDLYIPVLLNVTLRHQAFQVKRCSRSATGETPLGTSVTNVRPSEDPGCKLIPGKYGLELNGFLKNAKQKKPQQVLMQQQFRFNWFCWHATALFLQRECTCALTMCSSNT